MKSRSMVEEAERGVEEAERVHQGADRRLEEACLWLEEIELAYAKIEEELRRTKWLVMQSGRREDAPAGLIEIKLSEIKKEKRDVLKRHSRAGRELTLAGRGEVKALRGLHEARVRLAKARRQLKRNDDATEE